MALILFVLLNKCQSIIHPDLNGAGWTFFIHTDDAHAICVTSHIVSEVGDLSFACAQLKEVKEVENCYLKRSSIVRRLWMEDRYLPGFISSNHWDIWKFNGNGTLFSIFADFSNEIITWIGLPYIGRKAENMQAFCTKSHFFHAN